MRIALLSDGIYPYKMGGMQKHSYYLVKNLAQKGVEVDVYHAVPENQEIPSYKNEYSIEELQHIRLFPIPFPRSKKYPGHYINESFIYSQRVYEQFIKQKPVDFVYVQGFAGWELLKHIKSNRHKDNKDFSTGINFHGVEMFQKAPTIKVKLEHVLLRPFVKRNLDIADYIFSLGGKLTAIHKRLLRNPNIIELPIGITADWVNDTYNNVTSTVRKFVLIGRYERRKGIEELNYVLKRIVTAKINNFECHFIGPIPEKKQIKGLSNIIYHGAIHEEARIKEILQSSDVLLCPSWSEGMPTVILEAMASGCVIIATDVGAIREQVDSKNGLLIEPGNKDQLNTAIEQMIALSAEKLTKMKMASIQKIKDKFLWENVVDRTIEEITKALSNKS